MATLPVAIYRIRRNIQMRRGVDEEVDGLRHGSFLGHTSLLGFYHP